MCARSRSSSFSSSKSVKAVATDYFLIRVLRLRCMKMEAVMTQQYKGLTPLKISKLPRVQKCNPAGDHESTRKHFNASSTDHPKEQAAPQGQYTFIFKPQTPNSDAMLTCQPSRNQAQNIRKCESTTVIETTKFAVKTSFKICSAHWGDRTPSTTFTANQATIHHIPRLLFLFISFFPSFHLLPLCPSL